MSDGIEYYDWHGHPIKAEVYDATDGRGEIDVSAIMNPSHPTGVIPDGEVQYLCTMLTTSESRGFWATAEAFHKHAEPIATNAIGFDDKEVTDA